MNFCIHKVKMCFSPPNTVTAYIVAYLVDFTVAPSNSCPVLHLSEFESVIFFLAGGLS